MKLVSGCAYEDMQDQASTEFGTFYYSCNKDLLLFGVLSDTPNQPKAQKFLKEVIGQY